MFRFHPQHQKVLDLLNRNAIGKVFSFHGCYGLPPIPMTYKTQQGPRRRRVKRCCMLSYLCKQNCFPSRTNQCKLSSWYWWKSIRRHKGHGASWNFVLWGALHGVYLAGHKLILDRFPFLQNRHFFNKKIGVFFSIIITQYLVFLAWIPFRVKETEVMLYSMQKYVFLDLQIHDTIQFMILHKLPMTILVMFILLHIISYKYGNLFQRFSELKPVYWIGFLTCVMVLIFLFYDGNPQDFVYFQF